MNTLLEISSPLSFIELEKKEALMAGIPMHLPKSFDSKHKLLTMVLHDQSRLQEIYDLRLAVWENCGSIEFVNRTLFPTGWFDELDESAIHWVTINHQNKIVAAARLNVFHLLKESPYHTSISHLGFPAESAFAFYSRLVVDPQYRNNGLSKQLYEQRTHFCREKKIPWSQVFINNPHVIKMFEAEGFKNTGKAQVSYHKSSLPHSVNVFVKKNKYH